MVFRDITIFKHFQESRLNSSKKSLLSIVVSVEDFKFFRAAMDKAAR